MEQTSLQIQDISWNHSLYGFPIQQTLLEFLSYTNTLAASSSQVWSVLYMALLWSSCFTLCCTLLSVAQGSGRLKIGRQHGAATAKQLA